MITFSDWIYEFNWERNNISYKTNLYKDQLNSVSDQIKDYFKNDQEKIEILVQIIFQFFKYPYTLWN